MPNRTLADELDEICALEVPLSRRLELYVERQRAFGSPFAAATDALVERLRARDYAGGAPEVGEAMPDFLLPDDRGRLRSLRELTAAGPLVLSLNRGHWCPFCRIELDALARAHDDLLDLGARIVSILPDRQAFVGGLPEMVRGRLLLLSDIDNEFAGSMGLVMRIPPPVKTLMRSAGVDLAEIHGNPLSMVPLPATFVVGADGLVLARFIDPEFRHRMEPAAIAGTLRAHQGFAAGGEP